MQTASPGGSPHAQHSGEPPRQQARQRQPPEQPDGAGSEGAASMDGGASSVSGAAATKEGELERTSAQLRAVALFDDQSQTASRRYDRHGHVLPGGGSGHEAWYRRRRLVIEAGATAVGLVFILAGLLLQLLMKENHAFRWLYFFAALPFLWWAVSFIVRRIYVRIELAYFQELIYYWTSLRFSTTLLAFTLLALPLYQTFFVWAWCEKRACKNAAYVKASGITWNVSLCVVLFSLAHFLKSFAAKLISQHFYQTAHIAKVKQALEQEYYLLSLSKPRHEAVLVPALTKMSTSLSRMSLHPHGSTSAHPGAAPGGRDSGGGDEVTLHQQVEALIEAATPRAGPPRPLSALSSDADSFGPGGASSPVALPRLDAGRPWFWEVIAARRRRRAEEARLLQQQLALSRQAARPQVSAPPPPPAGTPAHSGFFRPPAGVEMAAAGAPPGGEGEGVGLLGAAEAGLREVRVDGGGERGGGDGFGAPDAQQQQQQFEQQQQQQQPAAPRGLADVAAAAGVAAAASPRGPGEQSASEMRAANAVAAKTFSALVRKYAALSEEEEAHQLKQAGKVGKTIFENCRRDPGAPGVTADDFGPFFPDRETAHKAFDFFDKDGDGWISKQEMKETVTAIVAERRDMATSLRDTDSIVASLEAFLAGLIHLLFIAFYLLVWDINVMSGFSTFSATVLALTFVFGESVKNVFQSAVWLFGNHALDVGDTILMPPDEAWYRVKKFGLVDTILIRENGDLVHVPNNKLWSGPIVNLTRSGKRSELTRILVDNDAPTKIRDQIQAALSAHASGPAKGDFAGEPKVRWSGLNPDGKARLSVSWTYAFGATDARYSVVRDAIVAVLKDAVGGHGALNTMPVRQVPARFKSD